MNQKANNYLLKPEEKEEHEEKCKYYNEYIEEMIKYLIKSANNKIEKLYNIKDEDFRITKIRKLEILCSSTFNVSSSYLLDITIPEHVLYVLDGQIAHLNKLRELISEKFSLNKEK